MVGLEIEKAERFLKQADMMTDLEQWDRAANRYYYACFHAVQALFIHKGLSSRRHKGMLTQFGLHFVKTGIIEDRYGAFLTRMECGRRGASPLCAPLFRVRHLFYSFYQSLRSHTSIPDVNNSCNVGRRVIIID